MSEYSSRVEKWLANIAGLVSTDPGAPQSRIEALLKYIAEHGGGGGAAEKVR